MTQNTLKQFKPFAAANFESKLVKVKGKMYTYFFFTGAINDDYSQGLVESLHLIDRPFRYWFAAEKLSKQESMRLINQDLHKNEGEVESELFEPEDEIVGWFFARFKQIKKTFNDTRIKEVIEQIATLEAVKDDLALQNTGLNRVSLILRFEVTSRKDADAVIQSVQEKAETHKLNVVAGYNKQRDLHETLTFKSPIKEENKLLLENSDVVMFNPFVFPTTRVTENSIFLGETMNGSTPFWLDFSIIPSVAGHVYIGGTTGKGKSALQKAIAYQAKHLGHQVLFLDPTGEYKGINQALGGVDIDLTEGLGINIFDLDSQASLIGLNEMVSFLFSTIIGSDLTTDQTQKINYCLNMAKKRGGNYFSNFLDEVAGQKEIRHFLPALQSEEIVKLLTDTRRREPMKAKSIRFSFQNMAGRELATFISIVGQLLMANLEDSSFTKCLFQDENFKFMQSSEGINRTVAFFRQLRKFNTKVVLSDQSIREYGHVATTIWENTAHHFLFQQNETENFHLNKETWTRINALNKHECFYHCQESQSFIRTIIPDNVIPHV